MNGLKVSGSDSKVRPGRTYIKNPPLQQEKEALDDLTMELELADEDQPVLYVREHPYEKTAACRLIFIIKATRSARPSFIFHITAQ